MIYSLHGLYTEIAGMRGILHTHLSRWEKRYGADTTEQTYQKRHRGRCNLAKIIKYWKVELL